MSERSLSSWLGSRVRDRDRDRFSDFGMLEILLQQISYSKREEQC